MFMANARVIWFFILLSQMLFPSTLGKYQAAAKNFRAMVFSEAIDDRTLTGNVLDSLRVTSEGLCQVHCVRTRGCESYNLGPLTNRTHLCQISGSNRHRDPQEFIRKVGFRYSQIKTDCELSPCLSDQICEPNYERDSYECVCIKFGYTGSPCACTTGAPLGMENGAINDSQISSSSFWAVLHEPWHGRLRRPVTKDGIGSWASASLNKNEYLQVDLGENRILSRVATQGRPTDAKQWVTSYAILYSTDGLAWKTYTENGAMKVFTANNDRHTVVTNSFLQPFTARYVRINPQSWYSYITLRAELYGCEL